MARRSSARLRNQAPPTPQHRGQGDEIEPQTAPNERRSAMPRQQKSRFSDIHRKQFERMESIASHGSTRWNLPEPEANSKALAELHTKALALEGIIEPSCSLKRTASVAKFDQPSYPRLPNTGGMSFETDTTTLSHTQPILKILPTYQKPVAAVASPHFPNKRAKVDTVCIAAAASSIPGPSPSRPAAKLPSVNGVSQSLKAPSTPFLCSPARKPVAKDQEMREKFEPLLLRTPIKTRTQNPESSAGRGKAVPFLSQPAVHSRRVLTENDAVSANTAATSRVQPQFLTKPPVKMTPRPIRVPEIAPAPTSEQGEGSLMERFKLLRATPKKSILRTPQRLYSNDPTKIAAGTHFATPPQYSLNAKSNLCPKSNLASQKRVDFSSSTKARYERAQSEISSDETACQPKDQEDGNIHMRDTFSTSSLKAQATPDDGVKMSFTSPNRRQTVVPMDFTFRAGTHEIVFGKPPTAATSTEARRSTIRHVSSGVISEQKSVNKKRKFEFEDGSAKGQPITQSHSHEADKENIEKSDEECRPVKRKRLDIGLPSPNPTSKSTHTYERRAKRILTLGVKPRPVKKSAQPASTRKPATISQSRLNMLAQPKRR